MSNIKKYVLMFLFLFIGINGVVYLGNSFAENKWYKPLDILGKMDYPETDIYRYYTTSWYGYNGHIKKQEPLKKKYIVNTEGRMYLIGVFFLSVLISILTVDNKKEDGSDNKEAQG